MKLADYLKLQENWIINKYMGNYQVSDYPAISFASWEWAENQINLANCSRSEPICWKVTPHHKGAVRVLEYPQTGFKQLWVEQNFRKYRLAAKNFLTKEWGVDENISKSIAVDHLVPKSRHKNPRGVTVVYFIPGDVNSSWGAGYEKFTKKHPLKNRHQLTLVSVAKTVGIMGPKQSNGSTISAYERIAHQLHDKGIKSKFYEASKFEKWSEIDKIENELKLAANYPGIEILGENEC